MTDASAKPAENAPRKPDPPGGPIPARARYRPKRNPAIPPAPTIKSHTTRLMAGTVIGGILMLALLLLAVKYAQRDWNKKNQVAWAASQARKHTKTTTSAADEPAVPGWAFDLPAAAARRHLLQLSSDRLISNHWLILSRGLSDLAEPESLIAGLRMAMAIGGEDAGMKNDLGVVYLQQQWLQDAEIQFRSAEQIRPGFPPARFNLALCAIAKRNPIRATQLLAQYLGQRPNDTVALRLQATLLSQLGRPEEALNMLEKFLRDQPRTQPLFLEAATLAARLGQRGNAIRYLETAMNGISIQNVVRAYQSPAFRDIRLSGEGDALAARIAGKARAAFSTPIASEEIRPLRATPPEAIVR